MVGPLVSTNVNASTHAAPSPVPGAASDTRSTLPAITKSASASLPRLAMQLSESQPSSCASAWCARMAVSSLRDTALVPSSAATSAVSMVVSACAVASAPGPARRSKIATILRAGAGALDASGCTNSATGAGAAGGGAAGAAATNPAETGGVCVATGIGGASGAGSRLPRTLGRGAGAATGAATGTGSGAAAIVALLGVVGIIAGLMEPAMLTLDPLVTPIAVVGIGLAVLLVVSAVRVALSGTANRRSTV